MKLLDKMLHAQAENMTQQVGRWGQRVEPAAALQMSLPPTRRCNVRRQCLEQRVLPQPNQIKKTKPAKPSQTKPHQTTSTAGGGAQPGACGRCECGL